VVPRYFFLTKGVGRNKDQLASFEMALRDALIERFNLVTVSSIVPPGCRLVSREKGAQMLKPGEITSVVIARSATDEPHRLLASSVGIAIPAGKEKYGYLSEHHSFGQTEETAGDYAEDLAATMLATTMGIPFDPALAWDERKQLFKSNGLIIKTANVTQSATGDRRQGRAVDHRHRGGSPGALEARFLYPL
jgi:arginine decarboxylase